MTHKSLITSATLVATLLLASPLALAQEATVTATNKPSPAASARAEKQAERVAKLADAKLKACQNREAAMQKRSTQLVKMTTNMETKFTAIMKRVTDYYTGTLVPNGKTVANYDTLVANVTTQKAAVNAALKTAETAASAFSCTSDDPKGQLTSFRESMQQVKSELKKLREEIQKLIRAIKAVAATPTPTATTSATPTPTEE